MPSALAVFRLTAKSSFDGCRNGRSLGFSPGNTPAVDADLPIYVRHVGAVTHQTAGFGELALTGNGRGAVQRRNGGILT